MNLHESAFPAAKGGQSSIEQMAVAAASMGLAGKAWAVFDVHHYFAWAGYVAFGDPVFTIWTASSLTLVRT